MNDVLKTYPVAPPSIVLAWMAMELAKHRNGGCAPGDGRIPYSREATRSAPSSQEYYAIIDRIARGEQP